MNLYLVGEETVGGQLNVFELTVVSENETTYQIRPNNPLRKTQLQKTELNKVTVNPSVVVVCNKVLDGIKLIEDYYIAHCENDNLLSSLMKVQDLYDQYKVKTVANNLFKEK